MLVCAATDGVDRARETLAEGARRVGSGVDTLLVEGSDAADALAAFDASDPRTLLCMTTRGAGAARRAVLGSTALSVVRRSPFAVVLIGPNCDRTRATPIEPIVACLDGTVDGEAVLAAPPPGEPPADADPAGLAAHGAARERHDLRLRHEALSRRIGTFFAALLGAFAVQTLIGVAMVVRAVAGRRRAAGRPKAA